MAVLHLADPEGLAAVAVIDDGVVYRILRRRPVVMKHVPLHATAYPRAEHPDICRLYDTLAVEYLISVGLVGGIEEPSSDVRKHADLQIVILDEERTVGGIHLLVRRVVVHRIGIDTPLCPLIGEVPLEKRRLLRGVHAVGREVNSPFPCLHRPVLRPCGKHCEGERQNG